MLHGAGNNGHQTAGIRRPQPPKRDGSRTCDVTEQTAAWGHVAVFGVKYHAELVHVKRKWMLLKRRIRPELDGKLGKLERLEALMRLLMRPDARKAARHCRNTMRAYGALEDNISLQTLAAKQKRQKSHQCVVDSMHMT